MSRLIIRHHKAARDGGRSIHCWSESRVPPRNRAAEETARPASPSAEAVSDRPVRPREGSCERLQVEFHVGPFRSFDDLTGLTRMIVSAILLI